MGLGTDSPRLQWKACDLEDLSAVRNVALELLAQSELRLDTLVCNAAVYGPHSPSELRARSDQMAVETGKEAHEEFTAEPAQPELTLRVNHLSHALLAMLLLERLQESSGRLVVVASSLYKRADAQLVLSLLAGSPACPSQQLPDQTLYAASKLAQCLFAQAFARQAGGSIHVSCVHPGLVYTGLGRYALQRMRPAFLRPAARLLASLLLRDPAVAAQPVVELAAGLEERVAESSSSSCALFAHSRTSDPEKSTLALEQWLPPADDLSRADTVYRATSDLLAKLSLLPPHAGPSVPDLCRT